MKTSYFKSYIWKIKCNTVCWIFSYKVIFKKSDSRVDVGCATDEKRQALGHKFALNIKQAIFYNPLQIINLYKDSSRLL